MERVRALVTGGAGFIGSHLCDRLLGLGYDVICLDNFVTGSRTNVAHLLGNARFELLRHDVNDPFSIESDVIFHLACPASPVHYQRNPVRTIRTCVEGTLRALECARETRARIFIASTSEVYGDPDVHPQPEGYRGRVNSIGPRACYDEGKRCAEALAASFAAQFGVDVRIARIFNTYGPRMLEHDGRVISNFIVQALRDQPITLYGDGRQTRAFCYVDDLLDAIITFAALEPALAAPGGAIEPINIGDPHEQTILAIAEQIVGLCESRSTFVHRPLPVDDPTRRCPDIGRAQRVLGWRPRVALADGLRRTIAYFRAVRDAGLDQQS